MVWILGVVFEFDWMIGRGFYDYRLFVKMGSSGNALFLFLFCVVFFFFFMDSAVFVLHVAVDEFLRMGF